MNGLSGEKLQDSGIWGNKAKEVTFGKFKNQSLPLISNRVLQSLLKSRKKNF